jgi:hypothetical protein
MKIPFIGQHAEGISPFVDAQKTINLYAVIDPFSEKTKIYLRGTPGLVEFCDTGNNSAVRQMHVFNDKLYAVIGNTVYEILEDGTSSSLGTITTETGHISMADNGTQLIIVDGTDNGYIVSAGALNPITDPDFPAATSVVFHDGYFIVSEANSGKIWTSQLYNGMSWNGLDFATAEAASDNIVGLGTTQQNIWLLGTQSVEIYYASGNPDFPFDRVPGAIIDIGCASIASIVEVQGYIYWLTNFGTIVRNEGYNYTKISIDALDYQISTYTTIANATSYYYTLEGQVFYVITFPTADKTWVYNITTGFWHEWESEV